ncbi:MAG: type II toxin-antitoxin system PemK/MazF family toxin [Desulfobacteraceae bacterium]|nr:type II toxin-antitoxin system PemK/MazF family toxin [Desulfobacteraceae bacterium]
MNIKRGEIFLAALDPVVGHEIAKTRPVIIVSNNISNQYSGTVSIIPITSKKLSKIYPFEVHLPKETSRLKKNSKAKTDQVRTIDKARLIKPIGQLNNKLMKNIDIAIKIHLDIE